ncbi:uncharacterized protein BDV14DRAFT_184759 [Aspergillus stella-maris]|uniref:uncharacterized protein n=1 Tax=Aspergillus stella-maris TaxID=1810926 RepID=UPI003CCE1B88
MALVPTGLTRSIFGSLYASLHSARPLPTHHACLPCQIHIALGYPGVYMSWIILGHIVDLFPVCFVDVGAVIPTAAGRLYIFTPQLWPCLSSHGNTEVSSRKHQTAST